MFKSILVAVDGSEHANRAVVAAAELARQADARLTLVHIVRRSGTDAIPAGLEELTRLENLRVTEADLIRQGGERVLEDAQMRATRAGLRQPHTRLEWGDPATAILEAARAVDADLIVMGRRGLGGLGALLLGSVSGKVTHLAPCACLTLT